MIGVVYRFGFNLIQTIVTGCALVMIWNWFIFSHYDVPRLHVIDGMAAALIFDILQTDIIVQAAVNTGTKIAEYEQQSETGKYFFRWMFRMINIGLALLAAYLVHTFA